MTPDLLPASALTPGEQAQDPMGRVWDVIDIVLYEGRECAQAACGILLQHFPRDCAYPLFERVIA